MTLKTGTIWHLSDLHLHAGWSIGDASESANVGGLDRNAFTVDAQRAFFSFIEQQRDDARERSDSRIANALVVSGDLVHQSGWKDAASVHKFLERLRIALRLSADRVLVVPGNHDVNLETARSDPAKSRNEFVTATKGYRSVGSNCESVCFEDDGLAFLLTDTVAHVGVPVNLKKVAKAILSSFPDLDAMMLERAIEEGVATEVPAISTSAVESALREIVESRTPALSESGSSSTSPDSPRLPTNLLGFLISHYPLLPCPYTNVEIKQFHLPVGAGPVKRVLADAGVYVCLHGHQHVAWVHAEKTQGGRPDVRFVCIGAGSLTQDDRAFNLIHYALMTETGEARIAVQPVYLTAAEIQPGDIRRFHVPARVGHAARSVRLVERIFPDGLVRGDKWFSDLSTLGWPIHHGTGKRTYSIPVVIQTDQGGPPVKVHVQPLTANVEAIHDPKGQEPTISGHTGCIRVSAPNSTVRVSLAYREFNRFAYCASVLEKARCFGGEMAVPDLAYDEEALVHVVRVPCERLEVYVRTPAKAPERDKLRLLTFLEEPNGRLVSKPELQTMTEPTIESWPDAKRIRLIVPRPMQGAAYGLAWRVPRDRDDSPRAATQARSSSIHKDLETIRSKLIASRSDAGVRRQLQSRSWHPFVKAVHKQLVRYCPEASASAEIALLIPDQPLLSPAEYQKQYEAGKTRAEVLLIPTLATFESTDLRHRAQLAVGLGVAGLAYATNRVIRYDNSQFPPRGEEDSGSPPRPYLELMVDDMLLSPHSKLYAYPLQHPELRSTPIGCVCIGSVEQDPEVDLNECDIASELTELLRDLGESVGVRKFL